MNNNFLVNMQLTLENVETISQSLTTSANDRFELRDKIIRDTNYQLDLYNKSLEAQLEGTEELENMEELEIGEQPTTESDNNM